MKRRHQVPVLTLVSLSCALLAACGGGDDDPATAANAPTASTPPARTPPTTTPPATTPPPSTPPATTPPPSTPPPSTPPPSGSNSAPSITGTPNTTVMQGSVYSFVPSATDADGNALT